MFYWKIHPSCCACDKASLKIDFLLTYMINGYSFEKTLFTDPIQCHCLLAEKDCFRLIPIEIITIIPICIYFLSIEVKNKKETLSH